MRCVALLAFAACAGNAPETRYYQLAEPRPAPAKTGGAALIVEPLTTDTAYDDERIVYRVTPYRLDYYNYHRWSATPGTMIAGYLERALEHSGRFAAVTRDANPAAAVVLGGRVIAIEEIDQTKTSWIGHVVIELTLTETTSHAVVWSEQYEENEPLPMRSPEGLARALSTALDRIALRVVPVVSVVAEERARLREKATAKR